MGRRAGLDGCGKSPPLPPPAFDALPSVPYRVATPTDLSWLFFLLIWYQLLTYSPCLVSFFTRGWTIYVQKSVVEVSWRVKGSHILLHHVLVRKCCRMPTGYFEGRCGSQWNPESVVLPHLNSVTRRGVLQGLPLKDHLFRNMMLIRWRVCTDVSKAP